MASKNADELLTELMKDYKKPEDLIGENGLLKQLKTACRTGDAVRDD